MNKIRRVIGITKFALLTTPAIALVLFGIQLATEPVQPVSRDAAPGTPPALQAAAEKCLMLVRLLPVAEGLQVTATPVSSFDFDVPGETGLYKRRMISVTLPANTPETAIRANMNAIARDAFLDGAESVVVFVFRDGDPWGKNARPLAMLTFAPGGDWDRTEHPHQYNEYQVVVEKP